MFFMNFFNEDPPQEPTKTEDQNKPANDQPTVTDVNTPPDTLSPSASGYQIGDTLEDGTVVNDSVLASMADLELKGKYGDFAPEATGEEKRIHIVTDKLDLYINSKGGE